MSDNKTGKPFECNKMPSVQEAREAVEAMNQLFLWLSEFMPDEIKKCDNYHDVAELAKSIITTHNNLVILLSQVCDCDKQFTPVTSHQSLTNKILNTASGTK